MAFFFTRTIRYIIFAIVGYSATQYLLRWKSYTISPKEFRTVAASSQSANGLSSVNKLRSDLRRTYAHHILDSGWEAIHGGGLSLRATFLYAAPTEMIVVLHAPYRTVGFSGWHWMNSTCTILNGAISRLAFTTYGGNKENFKPGTNFRHGEFDHHTYEFAEDTFVTCYSRGAIPLSTIWAGTGAIANGDPISLGKLIYTYAKGSFQELSSSIAKTFNYYKSKALKTEL